MICPLMNGKTCERDRCELWVDSIRRKESKDRDTIILAHCGLISRPVMKLQDVRDGMIICEDLR